MNLSSEKFIFNLTLSGDGGCVSAVESKSADSGESLVQWQHIDLTDPDARNWLEGDAGLSAAVSTALSEEETRPRSLLLDNGLIVVLRGVNMNPGHDAEDMVSVRIWMDRKRIVSARRRPILTVQDIAADLNIGQGPKSSGEFLTELVNNMADRIGDFVNGIEDELGVTEDNLETLRHNELRSTLGSLRRQIASVRRYMAPQRDALDRLNYLQTDILNERDRQRLREESDRVSRYLEDLDLARERAIVLQEAFLSQIAQQQNSRMYVLSVVAAIFLPLTFVTGLLGMNVGGLPGLENSKGFAWAAGIMFFATFGLIALFKWRKWI